MTDIQQALHALVKATRSQAAAARMLKVSRHHVNHLLKGRKEFGPELALRLGFRRVVTFQRLRRTHGG